jgi:hypothetical protein
MKNENVVGQVNNQVPTLGPAHEQRHVRMIFEGAYTINEAKSYSCKQSTKEACNQR